MTSNHKIAETNLRRASGGIDLPDGRFMGLNEILRLLTHTENPLPNIPCGIKENVYFMVDNSQNRERSHQGLCSRFPDDCRGWGTNGTAAKYFYLIEDGGRLARIADKRSAGLGYCYERYENKTTKFVPLKPQPVPEKVLLVKRNYSEFRSFKGYKRRVTWLDNASMPANCCVEYLGRYPGPNIHRNRRRKLEAASNVSNATEDVDCVKRRKLENALSATVDCDLTSLIEPASMDVCHPVVLDSLGLTPSTDAADSSHVSHVSSQPKEKPTMMEKSSGEPSGKV